MSESSSATTICASSGWIRALGVSDSGGSADRGSPRALSTSRFYLPSPSRSRRAAPAEDHPRRRASSPPRSLARAATSSPASSLCSLLLFPSSHSRHAVAPFSARPAAREGRPGAATSPLLRGVVSSPTLSTNDIRVASFAVFLSLSLYSHVYTHTHVYTAAMHPHPVAALVIYILLVQLSAHTHTYKHITRPRDFLPPLYVCIHYHH